MSPKHLLLKVRILPYHCQGLSKQELVLNLTVLAGFLTKITQVPTTAKTHRKFPRIYFANACYLTNAAGKLDFIMKQNTLVIAEIKNSFKITLSNPWGL